MLREFIMDQHLNDILEHGDFGMPKFLEQWQEWGAEIQGDVFKFFCYYTAFNFLYNHWDSTCRNCNFVEDQRRLCELYKLRGGTSRFSEKCKICNTVRNVLEDNREFNPFQEGILTNTSEIITQPVRSINTGNPTIQVTYGDCSLMNIQKLFLNIYYIRCNLYHGSKAMHSDRDKALVKESAAVLEYFLNHITEKYK